MIWVEEVILPFVLTYRVIRRQLTPKIAWWMMDTWWPFKFYRRQRARYRVWKARRYRGNDEFHPSLDMDVLSMLEMTESEKEAYLADLVRRRQRHHDQVCDLRE